jgi:hypothetical protein
MEWSNEISFSSFNDAWMTFNTHYNNSNVTLEQFLMATKKGNYVMWNFADLINNNVENMSIKRLYAPSIYEAYPLDDRPRGMNDIESVKFHIINKHTSPCIIIKYMDNYILLDGMHRLVASSINKLPKIHVLIIVIDK